MDLITIISILLGLIVGAVVGYFVHKSIADAKVAGAKNAAEQILEDAKRDADSLKKEALLEAKDEIHKLRTEAEREVRLDAFSGQHLAGLHAVARGWQFYDDVFVPRRILAALLQHAVLVERRDFRADGSVHDVADLKDGVLERLASLGDE